jgi:recombination associated protein RdgC
MGVRRGSLSFTRFRVNGVVPKDLRKRYLEAVRLRCFAPLDINGEADESSGWCVLERPFDLEFDAGKLFYDRFVLIGFRVDKWRVPGTLVKAHLEDEEQRLLGKTGRERLGRAERAEIKLKVIQRLRRKIMPTAKCFDVVWDLDRGSLLFFGHSAKLLLDFGALFETTFALTLVEDSPYEAATRAELSSTLQKRLSELSPMSLVEANKRLSQARKGLADRAEGKAQKATKTRAATESDTEADGESLVERVETTRFLGSEFLLFIWLYGSIVEETISLGKLGDWSVWLDGTLALQSVFDPAESVSVRGASPATSPEAREAVKAYKFPSRARIVMRQDPRDFRFVLNAARFAISAADIPAVLTQETDDAFLDRMHLVEELLTLLDRLFATFLQFRLAPVWIEAFEPAIAAWTAEQPTPTSILQTLMKASKNLGRKRAD